MAARAEHPESRFSSVVKPPAKLSGEEHEAINGLVRQSFASDFRRHSPATIDAFVARSDKTRRTAPAKIKAGLLRPGQLILDRTSILLYETPAETPSTAAA